MKDLGDQKDNKNAYILFETKEDAELARNKVNSKLFNGKHLRVDVDDKESGEKISNDFETTIFIGNLPFITNEEELREHFNPKDGEITNVRIIRDPKTFVGKGIGYVQFSSKEAMREAITEKNGKFFKGRDLRVKKAVAPNRLEKKKLRKEQR